MTSDSSKFILDEKLAKELYKPAPAAIASNAPATKIELQRFQELEQQIKNNPASPEPYRELGEIYLSQNRLRDARRVLESGVRHNPDDESILTMYEESRLRTSKESMETAAKEYRWQQSDISRRELDQSELELAALQFEIAEARFVRHPNQFELLVTSAVALKRLARIPEAIDRLERAIKCPTVRAVASLNLGICLENQQEVIGALAAYRRAAIFRSPLPAPEIRTKAFEHAIGLSERSGLYDSAIRYIDLFLDTKPNEAEAKILLKKRLKLAESLESQRKKLKLSTDT